MIVDTVGGVVTQQYDAFGVCLKVQADNLKQLARLDRWLTVAKTADRQEPDVRLIMHEAEADEFEALINPAQAASRPMIFSAGTPASRSAAIDREPCRFDRRVPSSPDNSGTCRNAGGCRPNKCQR